MKTYATRLNTMLAVAFMVCFLAIEIAEARRLGGGGGARMSRGGPAASGSFQRNRARPSSSGSYRQNRAGTTGGYGGRDYSQAQSNRQDRRDQVQDNNQDRYDERQDRYEQRQENIQERQDFAKEVHKDREEYYDDRKEWYEDRWRGGTYISVNTWGSWGCSMTPVLIGADTYYECRGTRYRRVYRGGEVVYVVVN